MRTSCAAAGAVAVAAAVVSVLVGCAPALNWREARPSGSQAQLMFPCRPASHARAVTLAGRTVEMTMFACSAADTVFALSFADMQDPMLVGPALDELGASLRAHLKPVQPAVSQPLTVPGMTPHPRAVQWRQAGALPDGRSVEERAALFSHGAVVYQATMLGARLDAQAQDTFFGSVKVGQ
jgi:hypothetical protein